MPSLSRVSRIGAAAGALAFGVAPATPALGQAALSLDEAVRLSFEQQPALSAYAHAAEAAEQAAVAARQRPDPRLAIGVQNLPVTGEQAFDPNTDDMTMKTIGIMREEVRVAKRAAAAARYLAEADVSRAEQALAARSIRRDVMLAWTDVIEAQQKHQLHEELLRKLEARRATIEANVATGGSAPADAIIIRAEIAAVSAEHQAATSAEQAARGKLSRRIGAAAQRPLVNSLPVCRPANKVRALAALTEHPMLQQAKRQEVVATSGIDIARAERLPNWGWSVMYGQRGQGLSDMVSLQVTLDLPFNKSKLQNRRIAEASALAAAARDRTEDTLRELTSEFERAWAEWNAANARLTATTTQTLPALEAAEKALEARYAGGGGRLESVQLVSERTTEAAVRAIEERAAVARASVDLMFYIEDCGS